MIDKRILQIDNMTEIIAIAIKFDDVACICTIGGSNRHREKYELLMRDYFGVKEETFPEYARITKVKGKFTFKTSVQRYRKAIQDLQDDNFTVESVRKHGKLLR